MQTEIRFPAGNSTLPGVFTAPDDASGPVPALVMIYEALGMSEEMRRVARDLADDGYASVIPDLFARGRIKALCVAATMATAMRGKGQALDDLEAARRWLVARQEVDGARIGSIGFCMGGSFALLLARTGLYKVSAPFYNQKVELPRACPVVASYGGRDPVTAREAAPLEARLTELGVAHDVKVYPEAGHSFYTRTEGLMGRIGPHLPIHAEYHETSARDAHRRIVSFFAEHLAGAGRGGTSPGTKDA